MIGMSAATPTLIPRGGHFPALLPPVPSRGEPKPPTFRGRSDARINTVRDLAREMDDLSDEEAEVEGLVSKTMTNSFVQSREMNLFFYPEQRNQETRICLARPNRQIVYRPGGEKRCACVILLGAEAPPLMIP